MTGSHGNAILNTFAGRNKATCLQSDAAACGLPNERAPIQASPKAAGAHTSSNGTASICAQVSGAQRDTRKLSLPIMAAQFLRTLGTTVRSVRKAAPGL